MNIFYATQRPLIAETRVKIVVRGNTKFLERISKKISSVHILPLNGDSIEVKLEYPTYKSASRACKNFAKNKQIISVELSMNKAYK
jgi:hypothetical protein